MDVVRETWYRDFKSPTIFYTAAMSLQLFNQTISNCGGLYNTNAVTIQVPTMKFYNKAKGIPQYINMLEEALAQAERTNLPLRNDILVAIDNRTMLASNYYPNETKQQNKISPTSRK